MLHTSETVPAKIVKATDLLLQLTTSAFEHDVLELFQGKKHGNLDKYMYDSAKNNEPGVKRGAALWEDFLKATTKYYLLHEEADLLSEKAPFIANLIQNATRLPLHVVDLGPGSQRSVEKKTLPLVNAFNNVTAYTALDISSDLAMTSAAMVRDAMPNVHINALTKNFFKDDLGALLDAVNDNRNTAMVQMFLGGTVANFPTDHPPTMPKRQLSAMLRNFRKAAHFQRDNFLLVSHDCNQDHKSLVESYSEPENARFALNVLHKIRSELDTTNFSPDNFSYEPVWTPSISLLSHNAVAKKTHSFKIGQTEISVNKGQKFALIHSFKYPVPVFQKTALDAGFTMVGTVVSDSKRIAAHVLRA